MHIPACLSLILAITTAFIFFSPKPSPAECEPRVHIQLTTEFKGDSSEVPTELARLYLPDVSSGPKQIAHTPLIYISTPGALRVHTTWNYHRDGAKAAMQSANPAPALWPSLNCGSYPPSVIPI
ncbi:MAG: hypothetical protein ACLFMP_00910 [Desulfonatronovibrionaceae bacterium]